MSVLLDTSAGAVTVDLFTEECPIASQNFLKLAAAGMYDGCLFFSILPGQLAQTGDLTGTGRGGTSIHGCAAGEAHRFIRSEVGAAGRKHSGAGLLGMALHGGAHTAASQFYITLDRPLPAMDKTHTIFGEVVEGAEVLPVLSGLFLDKGGRPLQDVRIRAAHVLFDPTPGVPGADKLPRPRLATSDGRPEAETVEARLEFAASNSALAAAAEAEQAAAEEARSRAVVLEMVGDLPDADLAPPDTVLFVAKLNPVTTDGDLELIFSRHGEILSCEIQRDWKTGDSLGYAFIEFADRAACEAAYLKMNNVLIDDRRIKVDFSQSVAKLRSQRARAAAG
ncbi:CYP59, partial [Symbiodinium sp. KB8]